MFSSLTSIDWQSLYRVKRPPLANLDESVVTWVVDHKQVLLKNKRAIGQKEALKHIFTCLRLLRLPCCWFAYAWSGFRKVFIQRSRVDTSKALVFFFLLASIEMACRNAKFIWLRWKNIVITFIALQTETNENDCIIL